MRKNTPVREWMSRLPIEIDQSTTVAEAYDIMKSEGVRHIPVMQGAHLAGLVSLHDLDSARADGRHDEAVSELGPREVLQVSPTATLPEVCAKMAELGVGSAVVVDADVVVGIFTATDAIRFLASA